MLIANACWSVIWVAALVASGQTAPVDQKTPGPDAAISAGDRVVILGNTFAERMGHYGYFETILQTNRPGDRISVRNLGWSGDEVALQPRPLNFGTMEERLADNETDVIIACFGMNESFQGAAHLETFKENLADYIDSHLAQRYNGQSAPTIVLVSPIAHEDLGGDLPDPTDHNQDLARFTDAMGQVARDKGVFFIDLYRPTLAAMTQPDRRPLTINGIHPNDRGYRLVSELMAIELGLLGADNAPHDVWQLSPEGEALRQAILDKNKQFFYRWRPVNTEYIYGRRREPFGVVSFPPEMAKQDELITAAQDRIWTMPKAPVDELFIEGSSEGSS